MADFDYKNTWKMHVGRHGGQKNTLESLDFMYKILALSALVYLHGNSSELTKEI